MTEDQVDTCRIIREWAEREADYEDVGLAAIHVSLTEGV